MEPYAAPVLLFNQHAETIYPSVFRKVDFQAPQRERIITPDDDFLDLDWYRQGSQRCVIISHGLEGNSTRSYMKGMAKAAFNQKFDVVAWNFRGCSGEINRQLRFYHSGATDDLDLVVQRAAQHYPAIFLIGFSLGGNLTLKYLGERTAPPSVKRAVTFSVPIDLHQSCLVISKPQNWIYSQRFLRNLKNKIRAKAAIRSDLNIKGLESVHSLFEFDDRFTGPIHGFAGALDYYRRCSARYFMDNIRIPTLLVSAQNDPFLSQECYPDRKLGSVETDFPMRGGHVGFAQFNSKGLYWSERRALSFLDPL